MGVKRIEDLLLRLSQIGGVSRKVLAREWKRNQPVEHGNSTACEKLVVATLQATGLTLGDPSTTFSTEKGKNKWGKQLVNIEFKEKASKGGGKSVWRVASLLARNCQRSLPEDRRKLRFVVPWPITGKQGGEGISLEGGGTPSKKRRRKYYGNISRRIAL